MRELKFCVLDRTNAHSYFPNFSITTTLETRAYYDLEDATSVFSINGVVHGFSKKISADRSVHHAYKRETHDQYRARYVEFTFDGRLRMMRLYHDAHRGIFVNVSSGGETINYGTFDDESVDTKVDISTHAYNSVIFTNIKAGERALSRVIYCNIQCKIIYCKIHYKSHYPNEHREFSDMCCLC